MINTIITCMWGLRLRFYRFFMAFRVFITKVGIKQVDLGRLTMFYQKSDRISYVEANELYLGPDFLKDEFTLLDTPLLHSPHYKLVSAISKNDNIQETEYYQRIIKGLLDWRFPIKPDISKMILKFRESRECVLKENYTPVVVYCVKGKYYIFDGKHHASMCAMENKKIRCMLVDSCIAWGGVFHYLFEIANKKRGFKKHIQFYKDAYHE